jgi:hypothetical protein
LAGFRWMFTRLMTRDTKVMEAGAGTAIRY